MHIVVDDASIDLELPRENVKLGEVIQEVEDYLFSIGKVPISLEINDKPLTQEELEAQFDQPVTGQERLKFKSTNVVRFVMENIAAVRGANQELLKILKNFADEIHGAKAANSSENVVIELNHFFDFWLKLSGMLPEIFEKVEFGGKTLATLFEDIRDVLAETVQAMEGQDFVMAADLLRYEILPAIESIDKGIPQLMSLLEKVEGEVDTAQTAPS